MNSHKEKNLKPVKVFGRWTFKTKEYLDMKADSLTFTQLKHKRLNQNQLCQLNIWK